MQLPTPPLTEHDVHLWMLNPKQITQSKALHALLSEQEKLKVARYSTPSSQHNALITRAFVRLLLSQYAPLAAHAWQFSQGKFGKPFISNAPFPLHFNLSHNDDLIIMAVSLDRVIGCDIENIERKVNINKVAKRFFSAQEAHFIESQPARFFEYWTLKEAFVKATGLGISQGFSSFSFHIKPAQSLTFNDNISLSFTSSCSQKCPEQWYQALLFPDERHCIGLSLHHPKPPHRKPRIRLFSSEQSLHLFSDPYSV